MTRSREQPHNVQGHIQSPIENGKDFAYQPDEHAWYLQCRNTKPTPETKKNQRGRSSANHYRFYLQSFLVFV